jgi:hypothetical protein
VFRFPACTGGFEGIDLIGLFFNTMHCVSHRLGCRRGPSVEDVRLLLRTKRPWLDPRAYGAWLAISVVAYGVTYFGDPYVFAFTVLILGTLSLGVTLVGVLGATIGFVTGFPKRARAKFYSQSPSL